MNTSQMNQDAKNIGDALDAGMKAYNGGRGITQAELSRLSGVPQPTISRTLSGKSVPETETLSKLVAIIGSNTLGKVVASLITPPDQASSRVRKIKPGKLAAHSRPLLQRLCELAEKINDDGVERLIEFADGLILKYPIKPKAKQKLSA